MPQSITIVSYHTRRNTHAPEAVSLASSIGTLRSVAQSARRRRTTRWSPAAHLSEETSSRAIGGVSRHAPSTRV